MSLSSSPILRTFRASTDAHRAEGMTWYADAHNVARSIAADTGLSVDAAAGIIAALSPKASWDHNVKVARAVASGANVGAMRDPLSKAIAIREGADPLAVLGGLKVRAFYAGIVANGMTDAVCVDRHAIDVAYGKRHSEATRPAMTPRRYADIASAYQRAARILSREFGVTLTPAQVQAVTWVAWREAHGGTRAA